MGMLVLLPHTNRYDIDGQRHDFEGPVFLPSLTSPEGGLFMAVRDDRHPNERVFLHMPLAYVMQIMGGWVKPDDAARAKDTTVAFATQNLQMFRHFVLNVRPEHLVSEHGTMTSHLGHPVRVLRLRKPEKVELLEDYSN